MAQNNSNAPQVSGLNGGHVCISLGYVADAQKALLDLQQKYQQLQQLQRQQNILEITMQQGDGKDGRQLGTVMAIAKAAQNSADADAKSLEWDMKEHIGQAIGSGAQTVGHLGSAAYQGKDMKLANEKVVGANSFNDKFNAAASRTMSDVDPKYKMLDQNGQYQLKPLSPQQNQRLNALVEGHGNLSMAKDGSDDLILQHIAANPEHRAAFSSNLNQAKADGYKEMNTLATDKQSKMQAFQTGLSIGQQGWSAHTTSEKQDVAADKKGPADALRGIAQAADQNVSTAVGQGVDQANTLDRNCTDLNRAREALASNNGTAGS